MADTDWTADETASLDRLPKYSVRDYDANDPVDQYAFGEGGYLVNQMRQANDVQIVGRGVRRMALSASSAAILAAQEAASAKAERMAAQNAATNAYNSAQAAAQSQIDAKAQADIAKGYATGLNLPAVTPEMAGRFLKVNAAGTGYELGLITIATSAEAIAGTGNGLMTAALTKAAISAQGFSVGDYLRSEGNPGAKWLPATDAVYSQSAYPALFALLGARPNGLAVWSGQYVGEASTTTEIVFGGGYFLYLVGNSVYRTTDGISFSKMPGFSSYLSSAECGAYGNGKFCIGGQNQYLLSPDGNGLTYNMSQVPGATGYPRAIGFGEGRFASITSAQDICYSDAVNNTNWTRKTGLGGSSYPSWIAYGNGVWVFLIQGSGAYRCTDIVNNPVSYLSPLPNLIGLDFADMIFAGGLFVVTTNGGKMATSPDGLVWTEVTNPMPGNALNQIVYVDGLWGVQIGSSLYRTRDFKSWLKPVPFNTSGSPRCLAAGNGIAVAGATGGSVGRSAAYTYDRATQFAVFEVPNHYIKALP